MEMNRYGVTICKSSHFAYKIEIYCFENYHNFNCLLNSWASTIGQTRVPVQQLPYGPLQSIVWRYVQALWTHQPWDEENRLLCTRGLPQTGKYFSRQTRSQLNVSVQICPKCFLLHFCKMIPWFFLKVALLVAENIEEHKSKLKFFMQKFCGIIKTMDSTHKELSIAIRGYGFFATVRVLNILVSCFNAQHHFVFILSLSIFHLRA